MRMMTIGRAMLGGLALLAATCFGSAFAQSDPAANFPTRPIRVIIPFGAGGGNDLFARLVGQKFSELIGQTVVIENKPGAGGRLAAAQVMEMPADGYTAVRGRQRRDVGRSGGIPEPDLSSDQDVHAAHHDRELSADPGGRRPITPPRR